MLFQVSKSFESICKDSKYCPWPLMLPKDTPSTHSYWKTIPTASSMALNDRAPTHCYAHICDTANWNQKCMTCTFFRRLPWHPQQIFCTSTTLQNLKTVSNTAKNLLTAFIYISNKHRRTKELPNNCLPGQKQARAGNAASRSCPVISPPQYQSWHTSRSVPTKILLSHSPVYQNSILMETKCNHVCWGGLLEWLGFWCLVNWSAYLLKCLRVRASICNGLWDDLIRGARWHCNCSLSQRAALFFKWKIFQLAMDT